MTEIPEKWTHKPTPVEAAKASLPALEEIRVWLGALSAETAYDRWTNGGQQYIEYYMPDRTSFVVAVDQWVVRSGIEPHIKIEVMDESEFFERFEPHNEKPVVTINQTIQHITGPGGFSPAAVASQIKRNQQQVKE